eukprot:CAMPEP_0115298250 /NCGR_PEP_ID=MMETSP0270-20121206/68165_1 /TAXON_ID=71861 /ORGANISM="Scrippsiella trochoidea, Strain CCMP3099" /LENGTH=380 /DNA_ID=CAMNT_0002715929 /DNA_START=54 /DNA_END=1196 /DNA_ORIENTATION=-
MASSIALILPPLRPSAAAAPAFVPLGKLLTAPPPGSRAASSDATSARCGEADSGSAKSRSTSAGSSPPLSSAGTGGSIVFSPIISTDRFGLDSAGCTPVEECSTETNDGLVGISPFAHAEHARRALLQGFAAAAADAELPWEQVPAPKGLALPPGLEKAFVDLTSSPVRPPPGLCNGIILPPCIVEEAFLGPPGLQPSPHGCGALAASVCLAAIEDEDLKTSEGVPEQQQQQRRGVPPPPPALPPNLEGAAQVAEPLTPPPPPLMAPPPSFAAPFFVATVPPPPPPAAPALLASIAAAADTPSIVSSSAELALGSAELPTTGSAGHWRGTCKPCAFMYTKGCENGVACLFCHLCDAGEKQRRKRDKRAFQMAARRGNRQA